MTLRHLLKDTLWAPAASLTESLWTFIYKEDEKIKHTLSFLVLSFCYFKKNTIPGHQNFYGHLTPPGKRPAVWLVNIFRTLSFPDTQWPWDWVPFTSPPLLPPVTSLVIWHFRQHSYLLFSIPFLYLPVLVPLLNLSFLLGMSLLQL